MPIEDLCSAEELRAVELLSRVPYGRLATTMSAMLTVVPARHVVSDGSVLLRLHRRPGYHHACAGTVVAYGADNLGHPAAGHWSVQITGTTELVRPADEEIPRFGQAPLHVDGEPFEPVYMRLTPRFVTVHTLDCPEQRHRRHAE
ncbi:MULTISPECIES: pyridoxamine 5'-phosphate oxidase family protein [unclassified Streptomyces]|uniref:pyridoxamine 5'-phosphate oxidase family protein n=1 Tax=unclassified Streptomyces TaxID=2593676 RepID=UPI003014D919